jgi:hypothetical protein
LTYRPHRDLNQVVPRGSPLHGHRTTRTRRSRVRKTQTLSSCLVLTRTTTPLVEAGGLSAATSGASSGVAQRWNILVGHSWAPRIKWAIAEVRDPPLSLFHPILSFVDSLDMAENLDDGQLSPVVETPRSRPVSQVSGPGSVGVSRSRTLPSNRGPSTDEERHRARVLRKQKRSSVQPRNLNVHTPIGGHA